MKNLSQFTGVTTMVTMDRHGFPYGCIVGVLRRGLEFRRCFVWKTKFSRYTSTYTFERR